jgi:hypothetical protein
MLNDVKLTHRMHHLSRSTNCRPANASECARKDPLGVACPEREISASRGSKKTHSIGAAILRPVEQERRVRDAFKRLEVHVHARQLIGL